MSDPLPCLSLKHESGGSDVEQPALSRQLALPWPKSLCPAGLNPAGLLCGLAKDDRARLGSSPTPWHSSSSNRPGGSRDGWTGLGTVQGCRQQLGQCQRDPGTALGGLWWAPRRKTRRWKRGGDL